MSDMTQMLIFAGVVAGYAAAGLVWLLERRVRELRAFAAHVRLSGDPLPDEADSIRSE